MSTTLHVGDRDITVADFSAYKFLEATELLSRMLEVVPELDDVLARFAKDWREAHPERTISRAVAELQMPGAREITDEAWSRVDHQLTLTNNPTQEQVGLRVFPIVQRHAREHLVNLLALIITPNSELEEADEAGTDLYAKGGPVYRNARFVLHKARPTAMVNILVKAMEVLGDELREGDMAGALGGLMSRWREVTGAAQQTRKQGEPDAEESETDEPRSSTSASRRTRARSRGGKSSTASPTAS
jgi:hypothetical protein